MPPIALAAVSYICYWSPQRASNPPLLVFVPANSDFMTTQNHKTAIGPLRGLRTPAAGVYTNQFWFYDNLAVLNQFFLCFLVLVLIPYHLVGALPMRAYLCNQYNLTWIRKTDYNFSNTPQWVLAYLLMHININNSPWKTINVPPSSLSIWGSLSLQKSLEPGQSVNPNEPGAGLSLQLGQSINPNEPWAWTVCLSKWAWNWPEPPCSRLCLASKNLWWYLCGATSDY